MSPGKYLHHGLNCLTKICGPGVVSRESRLGRYPIRAFPFDFSRATCRPGNPSPATSRPGFPGIVDGENSKCCSVPAATANSYQNFQIPPSSKQDGVKKFFDLDKRDESNEKSRYVPHDDDDDDDDDDDEVDKDGKDGGGLRFRSCIQLKTSQLMYVSPFTRPPLTTTITATTRTTPTKPITIQTHVFPPAQPTPSITIATTTTTTIDKCKNVVDHEKLTTHEFLQKA
nr:hypothetical protein [Tanacetum cinerariifolium]